MKKIIVLLSGFFVLSASIKMYGQKSRLAVLVGPSIPLGAFGKSDLYNSEAGFASTGEIAALNFAFPLNKKWNFILFASAQTNPINRKAFEKQLDETNVGLSVFVGSSPGVPPPTAATIYKNWKFEKKSWFSASLHAGIQREWTNSASGNSFTLTGAVGASYIVSPNVKGSSISDTATAFVEQTKETGVGFSFHSAAGFTHPLSKKLYLTASLVYIGTGDIIFNGLQSTTRTTRGAYGSPNYITTASFTTFNAKQKLTSVNLLVGVGIRL